MRLDLLVAHRACQPVAAQHDAVPGQKRHLDGVDLELGLGPDRARDDVRLGVVAGLVGADRALLHQRLDDSVVAGQEPEPPVPHQVGAAVARPSEVSDGVLDHQRHDGGPHTAPRSVAMA